MVATRPALAQRAALCCLVSVAFATPLLGAARADAQPSPAALLASPVPVPSPDVTRSGAGLAGWHLDLSAVTNLPTSLGVQLDLETPVGVLLQLQVGHVPAPYLGLVADILQGAGALQSMGRPLVNELIGGGAWTLRLGAGYLLADVVELGVGYAWLNTRSRVSVDAVEAALNGRRIRTSADTIPMSLTVHALTARAGLRFVIQEHLVLRVGLGWLHGVGQRLTADLPPEIDSPNNRAAELLDRVRSRIGQYGFTPELQVGIGYRF
ncbi:MAG: hypothetical protein ACFCGT_02855 [Sandaracinaceae bacterium]